MKKRIILYLNIFYKKINLNNVVDLFNIENIRVRS